MNAGDGTAPASPEERSDAGSPLPPADATAEAIPEAPPEEPGGVPEAVPTTLFDTLAPAPVQPLRVAAALPADPLESFRAQYGSKLDRRLTPSKEDEQRIDALRKTIEDYYLQIPERLANAPDAQTRCLQHLLSAEVSLTPPLTRSAIISVRMSLLQVEIELRRAVNARISFMIVVGIIYLFLASGVLVASLDLFSPEDAGTFDKLSRLGIPAPIIAWSIIGSLTSMLLRVGNYPFSDRDEAMRWLLFRPVVGIVMGIMTYLMVTAGLIVLVGQGTTQTKELLWIIAFVGSFSDTLSINLLNSILGRFQPVSKPSESGQGAADNPAPGAGANAGGAAAPRADGA